MSFVSYSYFIFLAAGMLFYYILPQRFRWGSLLFASVSFCFMLGAYSTLWILTTAIITYVSAIVITHLKCRGNDKIAGFILVFCLLVCFGLLFLLKYSSFIQSLLPEKLQVENPLLSIAMPIGISFYMFQVTGYLIDVYCQKAKTIYHFGKYTLAITFFGKLTQGPIVPIHNFVAQFEQQIKFDAEKIRYGAVTILLGLFKKVVVADRLALVADSVFSNPSDINAFSSLIGIVFYAFQLYTDFAGYTDVAIGSALLFGIELPSNFKQPYLARSIADFWRRWHITLSTWLRTYIYIPLGGSRVSMLRWSINVIVVFLVSGIWHGAGFTFIVWGLLHGGYQVLGRYTKSWRARFKQKLMGIDTWMDVFVSTILTFILVCIAWTFFRAASLTDAFTLFSQIINGAWQFDLGQLGINVQDWYFSLIAIVFTIIMDIISEYESIPDLIEKQLLPIRWSIYLIFMFLLIMFGMYGSLAADSFIYVSF